MLGLLNVYGENENENENEIHSTCLNLCSGQSLQKRKFALMRKRQIKGRIKREIEKEW